MQFKFPQVNIIIVLSYFHLLTIYSEIPLSVSHSPDFSQDSEAGKSPGVQTEGMKAAVCTLSGSQTGVSVTMAVSQT